MSETVDTAKIAQAETAQRFLDDPLIAAAFDALERECFEAWVAAPMNDTEAQREAKRLVFTAQKLRRVLRQYVNEGTVERAKLTEIQQRESMFARWRRAA